MLDHIYAKDLKYGHPIFDHENARILVFINVDKGVVVLVDHTKTLVILSEIYFDNQLELENMDVFR